MKIFVLQNHIICLYDIQAYNKCKYDCVSYYHQNLRWLPWFDNYPAYLHWLINLVNNVAVWRRGAISTGYGCLSTNPVERAEKVEKIQNIKSSLILRDRLLRMQCWMGSCSYYRKTPGISRTKSQNSNVSRLFLQLPLPNLLKPGVREQVWRCSWSSTDRRCSNYIWVINSFIAY